MDKAHFDGLPGATHTDIKMLDLLLFTENRRWKTSSAFRNSKNNSCMAYQDNWCPSWGLGSRIVGDCPARLSLIGASQPLLRGHSDCAETWQRSCATVGELRWR